MAEQAIAANRLLLELEFHPAAIAALDAFIDFTWGGEGAAPQDERWQPGAGKINAIVTLGAFFGEVIRREFGGEWRDDPAQPDNPFMARVVLAKGHEVFAIGKVYKRLKNGVEDRLEPLYLLVRQQLGAKGLPAEADGWIRQGRHFERVSRPDLAVRFFERALALAPSPATRAELERLRAESDSAGQAAAEEERSRARAESRERIAELAERARGTLGEPGARVDRASQTLVGLDAFLDETFGREPVPDARRQPPLELALGAFLGELLCSHYRGEWREQPVAALARSQVVWPSGLATGPFELVSRRLARGAQASVLEQAAPLVKALSAQGDIPRAVALREEGQIALARGLHSEALACFERAVRLAPGDGEALLGKARALVALERMSEAREVLDGFAGRSDTEPERSYLAGLAADSTGDRVAAHDLFDRSKANPQLSAESRAHASARALELANDPAVRIAAIERIEDVEQAVAAYARLNAEHPALAEPWRERGVGLAMLDRTDEALECLRQAAKLEPSEPKSYDHEAVTLARLKRFDEAISTLDRGLRSCPGAGVLLARKGVFLALAGRTEEALRACDAALLADPDYAETWAFKGDIEQRLGNTPAAIASLQRYLAARPGSREKRVNVVRRQLWAIIHPGRALDRQRAQECVSRGLQHAQAGAFAEALPLFDEAVEADPLFDGAWIHRGDCLSRLSRFEDAVASLEQAQELSGPTSRVVEGMALCLLELGRGDDALRAYDRLLAQEPTSLEGRRGKARLLARLGHPAEALPLYERLLARSPGDTALASEHAEVLRATEAQAG